MKVMQELITNSSEAAIAEHSVHLSRSENDLKGSEMAVQNALVARSSRSKMLVGEKTNFSSVDEELDAVVSAKFFGAIADGLETVGSVIGNAAVAVGNTVVTAAETTLQSLPPAIKTAANTIGQTAVGVVNTAVSVGEMVVDTTVDLAGTALEHAQQSSRKWEGWLRGWPGQPGTNQEDCQLSERDVLSVFSLDWRPVRLQRWQ